MVRGPVLAVVVLVFGLAFPTQPPVKLAHALLRAVQ